MTEIYTPVAGFDGILAADGFLCDNICLSDICMRGKETVTEAIPPGNGMYISRYFG